jgi:hypothetical protein
MECLAGLEGKLNARMDNIEEVVYDRTSEREVRKSFHCPACNANGVIWK